MIQEPSLDDWLTEAKNEPSASQCGMYLAHNGVVRATPKAQVRQGEQGLPEIASIVFSVDHEGVAHAEEDARRMPGIYYVRTWLAEGQRHVGDSLMLILIGGDTRPHVIECLEALLGTIKGKLVTEQEIPIDKC